MDQKNVYLACPKERSMARRNLIYCLTKCSDRCDGFFNLPEETILAVIEADEGRHEVHYSQLKLFPLKTGKANRKK